jgi:hypothetical protein
MQIPTPSTFKLFTVPYLDLLFDYYLKAEKQFQYHDEHTQKHY